MQLVMFALRKAVFTLRTTSFDIGRCRTMSCAVWTPL